MKFQQLYTNEQWKDIPDFDGLYQISNYGRIKSFKSAASGKILSVTNKTGWYLSVVLIHNRIRFTKRIHRLVAEAFIPNPENKNEVNHIDCDKQNNNVNNLEWVTKSENVKHAVKNVPSMLKGINQHNKLVRPQKVAQLYLNGFTKAIFTNCKEAAAKTGICARNIHQVAAQTEYKPGRIRNQAGEYKWEFRGSNI